jgi:hypothetical protein
MKKKARLEHRILVFVDESAVIPVLEFSHGGQIFRYTFRKHAVG